MFAAGDAAAVPDLTQQGKIAPPTAQHATRQGKTLARNVAASLGYGERKDYRHSDKGCWWSTWVRATPSPTR